MALYCVLIESLSSPYSITGVTDRKLTGQSIALCGVSAMRQRSTAARYSLCTYSQHFTMVKFHNHFLVAICQILDINLRTFLIWFIRSEKPPTGVSKFFRMSRKIRTKFRFKIFLKIPDGKAPQGRSNPFQNIFFSPMNF